MRKGAAGSVLATPFGRGRGAYYLRPHNYEHINSICATSSCPLAEKRRGTPAPLYKDGPPDPDASSWRAAAFRRRSTSPFRPYSRI